MSSSSFTGSLPNPVTLFTTLKQFNQQYRTSAAMIDPAEAMRTRPSVTTLLDKYSLPLLFQFLQTLVVHGLSFASGSSNISSSFIGDNDDDHLSRSKAKAYDEQIQILCDTLDYILSSSDIYTYIGPPSPTASSNVSNDTTSKSNTTTNNNSSLTPETLVQLVTQAAAYSPNNRVRMVAVRYIERLASGQINFPKNSIVIERSILYRTTILTALCSRLADNEPVIAEHASNILFALCGGKLLLEKGVQPGIRREPRKSSTPAVTTEHLQTLLRTLHDYLQYLLGSTASEETYSNVQITDEPGVTDVRIYTLIARICGINETTFTMSVTENLVDQFFSSIIPTEGENTPNDPLLATNILALLPPFARSKAGFDLLLEKDILHYLLVWSGVPNRDVRLDTTNMTITSNIQQIEMDMFLGMYALDALANIYAEACNYQYTTVSSFLHKNILPPLLFISQFLCKETTDDTAPAAAMSTLDTVLGSDAYAVDVVLHNKTIYREWVEFAVSSNKELVGVCYQSIANILHRAKTVVNRTPSSASDASSVSSSSGTADTTDTSSSSSFDHAAYDRYHHVFEYIGKYCGNRDTIDILVTSLQDPTVPRTRYAAYDLLIGAVELPGTWGIRKVFGSSSLSGILLNRESESTKEGKEWKYGIIVAALENPAIVTLGEEFQGKLQIYRDAGPYAAIRTGPSVATESKTN